jgi:phosphocarrier protein FPr
MPEGLDWGNNKTVYLAIGFAGKGDEQHLRLLASLARVLQCQEMLRTLITSKHIDEVIRILTTDDSEGQSQNSLNYL